MIGKILGERYRLQEKIGEGGMALVYKGTDTLLGRTVAVKILRENLTGDKELVRSFRREALSAANLSHPNIVNVYDVGQENNLYYIVMEYIDGQTLKDLILEKGTLPPSQVVSIAIQICEALEEAHKHNTVHRDIKPHNILITPAGRIKVADFGIARGVTNTTITYTSTIIGSVHYLSPEQASGKPAEERSDIYSLGIVLYEMLTGTVPFSGENPVAVALKHIQENVPFPAEINTEVSLELEEIIMQAVEKNPTDRYRTAKELKEDLKTLEEHLKVNFSYSNKYNGRANNAQRTKNNSSRQKKDRRRVRLVIALVSIVVLSGLFFVIYTMFSSFFLTPEVAVPELEGLPLQQAVDSLQEVGLGFEVVGQVSSPDVPTGYVVSQKPLAGRMVQKVREIELVLSTGPAFIQVPGVLGKLEMEARISLQAAGFEVGKEEIFCDEVDAGRVISQLPGEGSRLIKGEIVTIMVSKGAEPLELADLHGLSLQEAETWLANSGLVLRHIRELTNRAPANQVINQFPDPGEILKKGDPVDLTVSIGPDLSRVQKYRITVNIPPERVPLGEKIEIIITDIRGEQRETVEYWGNPITVEGYERGQVTVIYNEEILAYREFPG